MKIVPKLTLALVMGTCVVLAVNGYFRVKREVRLFEADRRHDHEMIGRSLGAAVTSVWRSEGEAPAMETLDAVNRRFGEIHVRWIGEGHARELHIDPAALAGASVGEPVTTTEGSGSAATWYTYVPLDIAGKAKGALELSDAAPVERHFTRSVAIDAVSTALALAMLSALLSFVMGQWLVGAPVRALAEKARRIGRGDFSEPIALKQDDEFALLAGELNAMSKQLVSTLDQLRHADRLMTVGQLASGMAHELGTPLNVISARAGMLAAGETTPEETKDYARVIVEATERMTKIIRQLLQFARRKGPVQVRTGPRPPTLLQGPQRAPTDLRAVVREALDLLEPLAAKRSVDLHIAPGAEGASANVEVGQIQQVVTNLVMNAIQAMPDGGRVDVSLGTERASPPADVGGAERDCVCLRVRDNGAGIAREHLPHIFEPFFTTKDVGEGTGLGLAVTYGIIRDHGGWITVDSKPHEGTMFAVFLPPSGTP